MRSAALLYFVPVFTCAQDLPDAPGKEVVQRVCGACHAPTAVFKYRTAKEGWQSTLDDMVSRGANASHEEFETVANYLAKCFGPAVDVNRAPAAELQATLGISSAEAQAIVRQRHEQGDFKAIADLKRVAGLDFRKIEPLRYRLRFEPH